MERPRGGNYLNDYHPEENRFHPIPEKHMEEYQERRSEVERSLTFEELKQEMIAFKEMLHINAIRVAGHSIEDGLRTAIAAKESGVTPWLSPRFWGATFEETKEMFAKYVERAKVLGLEKQPLIVANELSLDCADDPITGEKGSSDGAEREQQISEKYLRKGVIIDCTARVKELVQIAREGGWEGSLTYAALADESVDWNAIEDPNLIAAANLYWGENWNEGGRRMTPQEYEERLLRLKNAAGDRPFVITEFGSVPQREGSGGSAFKLEGGLDYEAQAEAYRQYLAVLEKNKVGYFAFAIDEPTKEVDDRQNKNYGIVLRGKKGSPLKLTPAGEVFAEHNQNYSQNVNGVEVDV